MKSVFFMDIDTQRDFMLPSGALHVPGAERIIPKLRRLFEFARKHEVFIISSVDAHEPNDAEFKCFPPHCVKGTEGQQKIGETLLPRHLILENRVVDRNMLELVRKYRQILLQKQELDVFSNPMTERLLKALPQHAIVFGVATEYCVRQACLGLRRLGLKAALVTDAVRSIDSQTGDAVLEELRRTGVETITLEMLLGNQADA
jgi:nicotinamidase/pyrazinamidase